MRFLHISDLHFGFDKTEAAVAKRKNYINNLYEKIKAVSSQGLDYIFITGDIGWHALESDYIEADTFIRKLMTICNVNEKQVFLCPGNHDVDRKAIEDKQFPQNQSEANKWLSIERFKFLTGFENYISFCNKLGLSPYKIGKTNSYLLGTLSTKDINVVCLNSAWYAQSDEVANKMWIGSDFLQIIKADESIDKKKPTISIVHHPHDKWHEQETHNYASNVNVFNELCSISDIVLSGHTHETKSILSYQNGACITGTGAMYDDFSYENCFYLYEISPTKRARTHFFIKDNEWHSGEEEAIKANRLTRRYSIPISQPCEKKHQDFDIKLSTIAFKSLDEFVLRKLLKNRNGGYPIYKDIKNESKHIELLANFTFLDNSNQTIEELSDLVFGSERQQVTTILRGIQGTGKSTILSMLYIDTLNSFRRSEQPFYPIFIDLHNYVIRDELHNTIELRHDSEEISKIIRSSPSQKWILFIDGIDEYNSNTTEYHTIIEDLVKQCEDRMLLCIGTIEDVNSCRKSKSIFSSYIDPNCYIIETKSIAADTNKLLSLIKKLEEIYESKLSKPQRTAICRWIRQYCNGTVDYRTLLMFFRIAVDNPRSVDSNLSINLKAYLTRMYKITEKDFIKLSEISVKYILDSGNYAGKNRNQHEHLIYKNKLIRDFFFAYYFVYHVKTAKSTRIQAHLQKISHWTYIFPRTISRFISDLSKHEDASYVENLIDLYNSSGDEMKVNIGYILGRIEKDYGQISFIKECISTIPYNSDSLLDELKFRLFRTLSISLICTKKNANDYPENERKFLSKIITIPKYAQYNIELHCIYYYGNCELTTKENSFSIEMAKSAIKNIKNDIHNTLVKKVPSPHHSSNSLLLDIVTYFSTVLFLVREEDLYNPTEVYDIINSQEHMQIPKYIIEYARNCCYSYDLIKDSKAN